MAMDFDNLDSLERYALAPSMEERSRLVAEAGTPVTPGQMFLGGLHALECGEVPRAQELLQRIKATQPWSEHAQRLEALVALRCWPADPDATCRYLKDTLGLSFGHAPPPDTGAEATGGDAGGQAAPSLATALEPEQYSGTAFLKAAVSAVRHSGGGLSLGQVLSASGMAAALAAAGQLGLTKEERTGLASRGEALLMAAGHPGLLELCEALMDAQQASTVEQLLPLLTAQQLAALGQRFPEAAAAPSWVAATVRKMYADYAPGTACAFAASDLLNELSPGTGPRGGGPAANCNVIPAMSRQEQGALQAAVLRLCDQLRAAAAVSALGDPRAAADSLAWLEARALLPLAQAAVEDATAAAAAGAEGAAAEGGTLSRACSDASALLGRLLRCLACCQVPGLSLVLSKELIMAKMAGHSQIRPPAPAPDVDLGPALLRLPNDVVLRAKRLLAELMQVMPSSPKEALFAAGAPLCGALEPSAQARMLAEAMLTRGGGGGGGGGAGEDGAAWSAAYVANGGDPAALAQKVELELGAENPDAWLGPDAEVALVVRAKAVQRIVLLVYEISTEAYYKEKLHDLDMGVDLEGLGPTWRLEVSLAGVPPLQRVRRRIALPQLQGRRGVWVVEAQGGGQQCRALVRKGQLAAVVRPGSAGVALTLLREDGTPVEQPSVWLDGKLYTPPRVGAGGASPREVLLPYRPGNSGSSAASLVLVEGPTAGGAAAGGATAAGGGGGGGSFACLMAFDHPCEEYELSCGMHFEAESAGSRGSAPLLLQPALSIGGWPAPLSLLQDVVLTLELTDMEGNSSSQTVSGLQLGDGSKAVVQSVRVPERAAQLCARLTARLQRVAPGSDGGPSWQDFCEERRWQLNGSEGDVASVRDLHLARLPNGHWGLRLLGRVGEPWGGVEVVVAMTHAYSMAAAPPLEDTDDAPRSAAAAAAAAAGGVPGAPAAAEEEAGLEAADPGADGAAGGGSDGQAVGLLGGEAVVESGISCPALVVKRTLVTDASGTVDLGPLDGITAVAAAAPPSTPGGPRGRYRWRLPASGAPADIGVPAPYSAGGGGGSSMLMPGAMDMRRLHAIGGPDMQLHVPVPWRASEATARRAPEGARLLCISAAAGLSQLWPKAFGDVIGRGDGLELAADVTAGHVAADAEQQGYVTLQGLPPGVYMLIVPSANLMALVFAFKGPAAGPAPAPPPGDQAAGQPAPAASGSRFVLDGGTMAPLSEPAPLQVLHLRASAAEGVTARVGGSRRQLAGAVAHVVLTRFTPLGPAAPRICSDLARPPGGGLSAGGVTAFGLPGAEYKSGVLLGDEVRYVLDRRQLVAEGRVRALPQKLDRPSLLVHPWKVRDTVTRVKTAQAGGKFAANDVATKTMKIGRFTVQQAAGRGPGDGGGGGQERFRASNAAMNMNMEDMLARGERLEMLHGKSDNLAACAEQFKRHGRALRCAMPALSAPASVALAFCPPAVVIPNVPIAADGTLSLTPQQLAAAVWGGRPAPGGGFAPPWTDAGHTLCRLAVYSAPTAGAAACFGGRSCVEAWAEVGGGPAPGREPRDTAMTQRPFPAGAACVESRSVQPLPPGHDLVLADASTAKHQIYATLPKVWALYGALLRVAPHHPGLPYAARAGGGAPDAPAAWAEFGCVGSWHTLSSSAKVSAFNRLACRELAFFTACKDAPFFKAVVLPCLELQLPHSRCLLDEWLLGMRGAELAASWGTPAKYSGLTPLERILLALEEDLMEAAGAGADPPGQARRSHLARLAADMRARVRRRNQSAGPAACAAAARQRFEVSLAGPGGAEEEEQAQRAMEEAAFDDLGGAEEGGVVEQAHPMAAPMAYGAPPPPPPPPAGAAAFGGAVPMMAMAAPMMMPEADTYAAHFESSAQRQQQLAAAPVYRPPQATKEWAEAGWYKRTAEQAADPDGLSPESDLWADLAEHLAKGGRLEAAAAMPGADPRVTSGPTFLPARLESGGWGFTDALLATAVVGMPFEDSPPLAVTRGTRLTITLSSPAVAYVRQTAAAAAAGAAEGAAAPAAQAAAGAAAPARVLLQQRLMDPTADPAERRGSGSRSSADLAGSGDAGAGAGAGEEDGEEEEEEGGGCEVTGGEVVAGRVYMYRVTATNSSGAPMSVDVTVQAPKGSVPLGGHPAIWTQALRLGPYATQQLAHHFFYFPAVPADLATADGEPADAFPAAAAVRGKLLAVAAGQPASLQVLPRARSAAAAAAAGMGWRQLCGLPAGQQADEARINYLATGDLSGADLGLVLWRCKDKAFWEAATTALRARHAWHDGIWSYAVQHQSAAALAEYAQASSLLVGRLDALAPAAGQLLAAAPPPPGHMHTEYWPLVNARAHALGGRQEVLNDAAQAAWRALLQRLAACAPASGAAAAGAGAAAGPQQQQQQQQQQDLLAACYQLALQDRPQEASALLARAGLEAGADGEGGDNALCALQLKYLQGWLLLAEPTSTAQELRAAAARLQRAPGAAGAATSGDQSWIPDPKWRAKVESLLEALEATAAAAEGDAGAGAAAAASAASASSGGAAAGAPAAAAAAAAAQPVLLLYASPEGPRGAVVMEVAGVSQVELRAYDMDLELLFSARPFDETIVPANAPQQLASGPPSSSSVAPPSATLGNFAFVRASRSALVDVGAALAAGAAAASGAVTVLRGAALAAADAAAPPARLLLRPELLLQQAGGSSAGGGSSSGAMLLEAVAAGGSGLSSHVACYNCLLRAVPNEAQGTVTLLHADTGAPVALAYVKAYVRYTSGATAFHKDGYSDRRGVFDYWSLTSEPPSQVSLMSLFIGHPGHGATVLQAKPPPH